MKINSSEKLRKNREISLKRLDVAMDQCKPQFNKMLVDVKKSKNKFLSSWMNYKNHKISDKEFLQITDMLKLFFEEVSWFDSLSWKMRRCPQ